MKTYTFPFVFCVFLTLSMSGQEAAKKSNPVVSSVAFSHNHHVAPSHLISCDGILPNFTNAIPNGGRMVTSQDFDINFNAYDNMAADDFVAPGSGESTICEIFITGVLDGIGFSGDPDSEIVFRLFENDGELPGALIYNENFPGTVDDNNDGDFILKLTGGPALTGGTIYWLSVQAILNATIAGQWYWNTATDGNGEIYAWQNPPGGFGFGCLIWSPHTNCSLAYGPDLLMDISFNETLETNSNSLETAVKIYPNPAKNQFAIQSDVPLEKLTIYGVSGRMLCKLDLREISNEKIVDISSLAPGIYIVRITGANGSIVKNLVKQ
ncbi:MAG: T9SS type A sorting domain-containing protein [Aequorivita sp.]